MSNEVERKITQLSSYWGIPEEELVEFYHLSVVSYLVDLIEEVNRERDAS